MQENPTIMEEEFVGKNIQKYMVEQNMNRDKAEFRARSDFQEFIKSNQ
jgi:hypothetical protein